MILQGPFTWRLASSSVIGLGVIKIVKGLWHWSTPASPSLLIMCDFFSGYKLSTLAGCPSVLPLGTSCRMTLCRSTLSLHPAPILPLVTVTTPNGYALPSCPYNWESFHLIVISEHSSVMAFPAVSLGLQVFKFWAQLFWQFGSGFGLQCPLPSHCRRRAPLCMLPR